MDKHRRRPHNHPPSPEDHYKKIRRRPSAIQPCFSGVSGAIFILIFICINVVVFLMEGPFIYMNIIYTLYVIIIAAFVFQILLDLGIWEWTKTGNPDTRSFLSRFCPALCICLSLPPVALLWDTKNRGGFTTGTSDISLIFTILIVALEIFHLTLTILLYKNYSRKDRGDSSVRFSYYTDSPSAGPSPASSIRSGRIEFIMNRSRNSLASIDSGFLNNSFDNARMKRPIASAEDISSRFWEQHSHHQNYQQQQQQHQQQRYREDPNLDDIYLYTGQAESNQYSPDDNNIMYPYSYGGSQNTSTSGLDRREYDSDSGHRFTRRDSDISFASMFSNRLDGGSVSNTDRHSSRDDESMDIQSVRSKGSNRSRSRHSRDYGGYRVEEEMVYQPGFM